MMNFAYFAENIDVINIEMVYSVSLLQKYVYRHQNYVATTCSYRDIDENVVFNNGGLNLHIVQIAQG